MRKLLGIFAVSALIFTAGLKIGAFIQYQKFGPENRWSIFPDNVVEYPRLQRINNNEVVQVFDNEFYNEVDRLYNKFQDVNFFGGGNKYPPGRNTLVGFLKSRNSFFQDIDEPVVFVTLQACSHRKAKLAFTFSDLDKKIQNKFPDLKAWVINEELIKPLARKTAQDLFDEFHKDICKK